MLYTLTRGIILGWYDTTDNSEDTTAEKSTPDTNSNVAGRKDPGLAANIDGLWNSHPNMLHKL